MTSNYHRPLQKATTEPSSNRTGISVRIAAIWILIAAAAVAPCTAGGESEAEAIARLGAAANPSDQRMIAQRLLERVRREHLPAVADSLVCFLYAGEAREVSLAMDLNGWSPSADPLQKIPGTPYFFRVRVCNPKARFEYKFVVDSVWMLDPLNARQILGGFGPNSEIWMPEYIPPPDIVARQDLPRGRLDTIIVRSNQLNRSHSVTVYLPAQYAERRGRLPVIFVTDGGEYLRLARMNVVMDNCIAQGRIRPVIGVFVDPMTEPGNAATSTRMTDYALNEKFLRFLADELRPIIAARYRATLNPGNTAVLGASLGGLTATFAALKRPDAFALSAAQSPAYWYMNDSLFTIARGSGKVSGKFYIDAGTLESAPRNARRMRDLLRGRGLEVRYSEYPEAHNWGNWRARLDDILEYFWGSR